MGSKNQVIGIYDNEDITDTDTDDDNETKDASGDSDDNEDITDTNTEEDNETEDAFGSSASGSSSLFVSSVYVSSAIVYRTPGKKTQQQLFLLLFFCLFVCLLITIILSSPFSYFFLSKLQHEMNGHNMSTHYVCCNFVRKSIMMIHFLLRSWVGR